MPDLSAGARHKISPDSSSKITAPSLVATIEYPALMKGENGTRLVVAFSTRRAGMEINLSGANCKQTVPCAEADSVEARAEMGNLPGAMPNMSALREVINVDAPESSSQPFGGGRA